MPEIDETSICPECYTGKCPNCDGTTWSNELDKLVKCPCFDKGHPRSLAK